MATIIFLVRLPGTKTRNARRIAAGNRRRMEQDLGRPMNIALESVEGEEPAALQAHEDISSALASKLARDAAGDSLTALPAHLNSCFALPGTHHPADNSGE